MALTRTNSLVIASLDIGRVLAERDGVTFRAQGTCMYPTVRAGDVLRIQPCTAAQVKVGDIAVCRGAGFLFSHRVIATGERAGRVYIVTRPDRTRQGSDAPTFDENLLGVVVTLTRNGTPVPLTPTAYPFPLRWYYNARLVWSETQPRAWLAFANTLARVQNTPPYQFLGRRVLSWQRPRISYRVRIPFAKLGDAVYQQFNLVAFDLSKQQSVRAFERWTLALHMNDDREPSAWTTLQRDAANMWHVQETHVRARYRGTGLDEILFAQANQVCGKALTEA